MVTSDLPAPRLSASRYTPPTFWIYDHEYRPHSRLYGVPFQFRGWICYSDSRSVHVCCFHLAEPDRRFAPPDLAALLDALPVRPGYVSLWGRLDPGLRGGQAGYVERQFLGWGETAAADVVHLADVDPLALPDARRAAARSARAGYRATLGGPDQTVSHLRLMDHWLDRHPVSRLHRVYALQCMAAQQAGEVERYDVHVDGQLAGFGIVSFPTASDAVYLQGFFDRRPGAGATDCLLAEVVRRCHDSGVERLHLGYTRTDGLRRFKQKWGAVTDPRTRYEQVVLIDPSCTVPPGLTPRDAAARVVRWSAEQA